MHKDVYIWQRYFYDTTIFFEFRTVTHYFSHSSFIMFFLTATGNIMQFLVKYNDDIS